MMNGPQIALLALFGFAMLVMGGIATIWILSLVASERAEREREITQKVKERVESMTIEDWQKVIGNNILWKKMQEESKNTCTRQNVDP